MAKREKRHRVPPAATKRARTLRSNATWPERRLWQILRRSQLGGLKFRRQFSIGAFVVDFCCPSIRMVIELDGESHVGTGVQDAARTEAIERYGYSVIRVTNDDVLRNPEAVALLILRAAGIAN